MKDNSRIHYQTFHHLFLYLTEKCQLRCRHCYMGKRLERKLSMSYSQASDYITLFYRLGARDLTILGGEPTIHKDLVKLIKLAKKIGYQRINVDTNGLLIGKFKHTRPEDLNYIRFSLDGPSSDYHEYIRGPGTFDRTLKNIKTIINLGFKVAITSTITKHNYKVSKELLLLSDSLGIQLVNFHVLSEEGNGKNMNKLALSPKEWVGFCEYLESIKDDYQTAIWYPPSWCSASKLEKFIHEGYQGCLGVTMDRLSVFPDGTCYICSVMFDKEVWFGKMKNNKFILNRKDNEFEIYVNALISAEKSYLSGCPAESTLHRNITNSAEELVSVCRCWKSQI